MDITPTVLALLGQPVAEDMDGQAIEECLTEEFLRAHPIRTVPTYETEERVEEEIEVEMTEEVRARLRELGYID